MTYDELQIEARTLVHLVKTSDKPVADTITVLRDIAARARQDAIEEAAKAACEGCAEGIPFVDDGYHADGYGTCRALPIRRLVSART